MNKIIVIPRKVGENQAGRLAHTPQDIEITAIANNLTFLLIQQALDDVLVTRDWKQAKKNIEVAIKRGNIHSVVNK